MKRSSIFILTLCLIFVVGCKKEVKKEEGTTTAMTAKKVKMKLEPKSGSSVKGNVVFTEEDGEIKMVAMIEGLEPGVHAIHIHEKADCSAEDGTSTGGHWNPTAQPHGKWGDAAGYHKGDIGNLTADEKGYAVVNFSTDEWCIGCGDTNKDILGKAIIVHAGTDDFTTQPTGAAGGRVSCGGIIE
ncbi:superoxide dismutase family protein [Lacinutrix iliipiscaria]|uniref:Superoxide dismutase family protein n=1 Tax=Lacinutrix iliipiscaria TaxID=1230532 RepID=A0ABW5WRB8_9FLAO